MDYIQNLGENLSSKKYGDITLILGCMFAGKSSETIRRAKRYQSVGKKVFAVKHSNDNRYDSQKIVSHNGETLESYAINDLNNIISWEEFKKADLIVIEEAQFFSQLIDFCKYCSEEMGKDVLVSGLDGNFNRQPFQHSELLQLIPICNNVYKLHALCQICFQTACFTKLLKKSLTNNSDVLIGAKDMYIPVCRYHYLEN